MRSNHVRVRGANIQFAFRGKSGVKFRLQLSSRRLAKIVKRCQELPGQELFQYVDIQGAHRNINSSDVNEYLRRVTRTDFTAKDFRTWAGTVLAARELCKIEGFASQTQAKRNIANAIRNVAKKLGNTHAVCRKCYVHPVVVDSYLDGSLVEITNQHEKLETAESPTGLHPQEVVVMILLQRKLRTRIQKQAA